MKVALVQTAMGLAPEATVPAAETMMQHAIAGGRVDLMILPEYFSYYGTDIQTARDLALPLHETPAFRMARRFAARHGVHVQAGTILARVAGDDRVENVSVVFDSRGEVIAEYRKIHLFDAAGLRSGSYRESDYIRPGDRIATWQINGVTFGTAICYDIRFPELFRALRLAGADVITLPAAFTMETGEAHWELLSRARAVETQCHVLACGLGGGVMVDGSPRRCFGHSLAIDPWGTVLARTGGDTAVLLLELDLTGLRDLRMRMPILDQRRLVSWDGRTGIVA